MIPRIVIQNDALHELKQAAGKKLHADGDYVLNDMV
jgi:hypothetical protein